MSIISDCFLFYSILNYSDNDGSLDMLPLLKKILSHHIPIWVFRYYFMKLVKTFSKEITKN